ncbi:hypothetical protein D3C76_1649730 [compost metagenome]
MNILINSGKLTTTESFEYILEVKKKLGHKFHIENEAIFSPVYKIRPDFTETYNRIREKLMADAKDGK